MGSRFWISVAALFVLSMAIGFLGHGTLLHGDYAQLPNLLRTEAEMNARFGWMAVAHLIGAFGFVWIYLKGREAGRSALGQGLRFGAAVALMAVVPMYFIYYTVQPWPGMVVVKQIVCDVIGVLIKGAAVALIHRGPGAA
jgi:hypothetical protein